ncbi:hypothetical protein SCB17_003076 [Clostridium perfringens]|nr:hypothetical protein [Clostridium perfringens]
MKVANIMIGKEVIFKNVDECIKIPTEAGLSIFNNMAEDMLKGGTISRVDTKDNTFRMENSWFWFAGE